MLLTILQYGSFKTDTGFLLQKKDYLHNDLWLAAFYIHVFSSIFTLFAGFTQFSPLVLKQHAKLHKWIGRLYAYDVMLINFPAGMIMAIYANGQLPSKIAFVILDCLWCWFTYRAVIAARAGDISSHRRYMIRSYALTLSALSLRTWKIILVHTTHLDAETIYMIDAWMGFVPNLLFAEWWIRKSGAAAGRRPLVLPRPVQGSRPASTGKCLPAQGNVFDHQQKDQK